MVSAPAKTTVSPTLRGRKRYGAGGIGYYVDVLRLLAVAGAVAGAIVLLFAIVTWLDVPVLVDPTPLLATGGVLAAVTGVALLVVDVLLPVPSSLVQVAHGAIFGAAVGTALSFAGNLGAVALGYAIGRRGSGALERFVPAGERARAQRFLGRWGAFAVVASRPVPVLAETVAIVAGMTRMRPVVVLAAGAAGALPMAAAYAVIGATGAGAWSTAAVLGVLLLVAGATLMLTARRAPVAAPGKATTP